MRNKNVVSPTRIKVAPRVPWLAMGRREGRIVQITPLGAPPYFILIDKALRDEGTSYHYLPPTEFSKADARLIDAVWPSLSEAGERIERGASWTTDAPFRETEAAIEAARSKGILAVEMEAGALYAFAQARHQSVLCFAHVTNQMGRTEGDFERGDRNGATAAIQLIARITDSWSPHRHELRGAL